MGRVVVREEWGRNQIEHPPLPLNPAASRRHGRPSWRTTNPRRKKRRKWRRKRKKLGAQVKLDRSNSGSPGRVGNWVLLFLAPSQMRNERRAAAVRRKAARMSAQAVRVNGRRVTGTRRVTRVAAVRMKAVRMRPGLPGTKRRSSAVMLIRRTTLTLMMRTEDGPTAVTMIQTVAAMGVASGAGAPAPSPVAASILLRRMAVKLQLLIPVKLKVTVTESQGLQG